MKYQSRRRQRDRVNIASDRTSYLVQPKPAPKPDTKPESVIPDKYLAARLRLALIIKEQLNTT